MVTFDEWLEGIRELQFVLKEENRHAEAKENRHAEAKENRFSEKAFKEHKDVEPEDTHDYGMYDYNEPRVRWSREDD